MLDFHCFDHPESWLWSFSQAMEHLRAAGASEQSIREQEEIQKEATLGIGPVTAYPPGIRRRTPDTSLGGCLDETMPILSQCAGKAMEAAGISPHEVDFVLTACTIFNPKPSLAEMIMHEFGMRSDCQNYNLSGQGSSAGVMLVSLARDLLTANPGTVALILAHDNVTCSLGKWLPLYAANVPFRAGGSAAILSSRPWDRRRAKYQLLHTVSVNQVADISSNGVYMRSPVINATAASAISTNIRHMAARMLPLPLLVKAARSRDQNFVPDFSSAFQHVCIHPGASTYYILAHLESRVGVNKGDKILQLGMGPCFKCCSAVWKALRSINTKHPCWQFQSPSQMP
ncbi:hypothetical protein WJX75_001416 [Coccomyxa subellipsoidea]|uniref:FAE domain-containing protein n=1 Tax=Coccomyxa subellipsoidea TaxID=248742 RepID=A0ABR2YVA2_9CHLO